MLVQLSGPSMALEPGDEREFPQEEAIRLIGAGFAVPAVNSLIEKAVLSAPAETRLSSVLSLPTAAQREQGRKRNRR